LNLQNSDEFGNRSMHQMFRMVSVKNNCTVSSENRFVFSDRFTLTT